MAKLHLQTVAIILLGLLSSGLSAQETETSRIKELYLSGNILTLNYLGLQYKSELKNGNFFRLGVTDIYSRFAKGKVGLPGNSLPSSFTELEGSVEIGLEKRSGISNRMTAFYGVNLITSTSYQRSKVDDPNVPKDLRHVDLLSISPGLGFNSGFIYNISDEFSVAAEVTPRIVYDYSIQERISGTDKSHNIDHGGYFMLNNTSVKVSIIYAWRK
jgi:hypothetical protein